MPDNTPKLMQQWVVDEVGSLEGLKLVEVPVPTVGDSDVLVKCEFISIHLEPDCENRLTELPYLVYAASVNVSKFNISLNIFRSSKFF